MAHIRRILDTNILINANGGQSPQTSADCRETCIKLLVSVMAGDYQIVIDGGKSPEGSEILSEYRNKLKAHGSGLGEMFLRWLLMNWQSVYVALLPITPIPDQMDAYEEFPDDKRLKAFDPRDRKWVAVARSSAIYDEITPELMQASDMKWKAYQAVLREHGVSIIFVCDESSSQAE